MADLECKKPKPCEPDEQPKEIYPPATEPFSQCVGAYNWDWDGTRLRRREGIKIPDGTYSQITFLDGCIVSAGTCPEPIYTPPYCSPNPTPCQDGQTGSGTPPLSPNFDNNLRYLGNGLFSRTYIQSDPNSGIWVSGVGTVENPYILNADLSSASGLKTLVGRNGVKVEQNDAMAYVGLEEIFSTNRTLVDGNDELALDRYGRVIEVIKRDGGLVRAGAGLTSHDEAGVLVIEHQQYPINSPMTVGAFDLTFNETGHLTNEERKINISSGTYNLGAYDVGVNSFGSITSINQRDDVLPSGGSFTTADGQTFNYDITGRLIGQAGSSGGSASNPPPPIRGAYKINFERTPQGNVVLGVVDTYGDDINCVFQSGSVLITLPNWISSDSQVLVKNASNYLISGNALTVVPNGANPFTLTLRG